MNLSPIFNRRLIQSLLAAGAVGLWAGIPTRALGQTELIANDKFADQGGSWELLQSKNATANLSVEQVDGEPALCVQVEKTSDDPVDIRAQKLFGEISAGKNYRVSFKIKSQEGDEIVPYIYPKSEGARVLWRTQVKTDGDWKEYTFDFKGKDSANDCVLGFSHLGNVTNKYWFKDVTLTSD